MNVLVLSKSFGKISDLPVKMLEDAGFTVRRGSKPNLTPEDLAREIKDVDVLIVGNDVVNRAALEAAGRLKLVHMHGTGLDGIDVACASEKGILVANAPGSNSNAVAEMILGLMLCAGRGIEKHARLLRQGGWERAPGHEVSGSVVGIAGLGNIGKRVVELLRGFSVRIVAYEIKPDKAWARAHDVRLLDDAETLFKESDYLLLALPLTAETRNFVNAERMALMKPSACIINAARGGLVDDAALCRAIQEKRLSSAALDAFAEEPLPMDSPLRAAEDILITPHLAATSIETAARVSEIVAGNIIAIIKQGRRELAVNHSA